MLFFNRWLKRQYHFLNSIELSKNNLISNYTYLRSLNKKLQIAPVLKSNAYGHGLVEIAQLLDGQQAPFFCVDSLHEAYRLYKAKIKTPILIMGYFNPQNLKVKKLPFAYTVYDIEAAKLINQFQPGAQVHIKVDTGMHRLGVPMSDLDSFITQLKELPHLQIVGLMSHFASATSTKDPLFQNQFKNFQEALKIAQKHNLKLIWRHIGATEAVLNPDTRQLISSSTNLGRVGKALYGYALHTNDTHLQPVLTLKTHIAQLKQLQKGDYVGYDGTFKAPKSMTIAVLPIGYNDGVDRRLSNKGAMTIGESVCPIVGRVSMNITTIDVSAVPDVQVGQEVTVISNQSNNPNSILHWADICDTIAHEQLVYLDSSTKRIIV